MLFLNTPPAVFLSIFKFDLDIKSLNTVVNLLMSKKITKSVLIDLRCNKESNESEAKAFLKTLYTKVHNRADLKA